MDTPILIDALRGLNPGEFTWKFALYSTQKTRDGVILDWRLCRMKGIVGWVEVLKTALLEKTLAERTVTEYSPFLSKDFIAHLSSTDDLIRDQIWTVLADLKNGLEYAPEDFISGALPKPAGYGFYGFQTDGEGKEINPVLFLRRSNPFLSGNRVRLCTTAASEIVPSEKPLLKFTAATDFLLLGDACFFLSTGIEKDFELENRHYAIASKRVGDVGKAEIVSDYETLEGVALSGKHARKFVDFDKNILEHITRLSAFDREEFLLTYGITIDGQGRMDTSDPEQCEMIIDLLCGRSCLDALGRLAVASNITPRD